MLWRTTALLVSSLALFFGCKSASAPPAAEVAQEAVSLTKWTDRSELFVEFPPLMTGKETVFAAHLTDLKTFKAVAEGTLKVALTGQGREVAAVAEAPAVAGIYRPVLKVDQPGSYRLAFYRYRPGTREVYDTIDAGEVKVLEKPAAGQTAQEAAPAHSITFLKEQQWRMDFATEPVRELELSALLKMNAEVKPAAGGQVQISAPFAGRIMITGSGGLTPGRRVKRGEDLAVLLPLPNKDKVELDAELRSAKSELEAAEKELQRVEELHKDKIVPRRRLEQSERKVRGLAVPIAAIVDDKGVAVSFVQVEGETFERRELELGIKSGGYAEVKSGLKLGERIVARGAYRVHLGSVSRQLPAHGHAH